MKSLLNIMILIVVMATGCQLEDETKKTETSPPPILQLSTSGGNRSKRIETCRRSFEKAKQFDGCPSN
ncbi:hypothetical protein [Gracilibacillus sp. JCM 18860]|uniref:hypothetical protein n=1 Tax=Gracilibacillus sp. JCM 18860 TaxID=1306159 RepID=UPI003260F5A5